MDVLGKLGRAMGLGLLGAMLALAVAARAGSAAEEKTPAKPLPLEKEGVPEKPPGDWLGGPVAVWGMAPAGPVRVSEYWLGVVAQGPLPDPLRAHLKLPANEGLLVVDVAADSPAAAARLQRFDVLVKAGDRALGKVDDLMDALDASKGQKMTLDVIREGQPKKIEVTPAKRPAEARPKPRDWPGDWFPGGAGAWEPLREWLDKGQPGGPGTPLRFRFLRPGVLLPPGLPVPEPMPADMRIAVTKQGNEPAKVVVTQGDKKWETTDDHLEKLPPEVRPHVERLLQRVPGWGERINPPAKPGASKARQELGEELAKARERMRKAQQEFQQGLQKGREDFRKLEQDIRKLEEEIHEGSGELLKKLKSPNVAPPAEGDEKPQAKGTAEQ